MGNQQFKTKEERKQRQRDVVSVPRQERQQEQIIDLEQPPHEKHCHHCGALITPTCEICPHCGLPIDEDHCTFCGTAFEGDEPFCSECGSPRAGIHCPKCGTLSFRSFCCHCNTPLNDNAALALELAKKDPKFQRACQLKREMAEMEAYLIEFKEAIEQAIADDEAAGFDDDAPDAPEISEEGKALQAKYAELMKLLGQQPQTITPKPKTQSQKEVREKRRREIKQNFVEADKIMKAYQEKAAEMQATLNSMLPDADMTPAQQRDYACARKIMEVEIVVQRVNTWWVCNFCGCYHNQPSECAEPWHGGVWLNEEVKVENHIWKYVE